MTELLLLLLLHAADAAAVQVPPPEAWEHADVATKRVEPAVFPDIPRWLTTELTRRHCSIPQSFGANRPHNIIRGFFNDGDVRDWAVLCSRERVSTILVFWDEQTQKVAELSSAPDANSLQVVRSGEIGFSRAIGVATPTNIRGYHSAYGVVCCLRSVTQGLMTHSSERARWCGIGTRARGCDLSAQIERSNATGADGAQIEQLIRSAA